MDSLQEPTVYVVASENGIHAAIDLHHFNREEIKTVEDEAFKIGLRLVRVQKEWMRNKKEAINFINGVSNGNQSRLLCR